MEATAPAATTDPAAVETALAATPAPAAADSAPGATTARAVAGWAREDTLAESVAEAPPVARKAAPAGTEDRRTTTYSPRRPRRL